MTYYEIPEGVVLRIKVIPKSKKNEVVGRENDYLRIRIAAIPDKGKANKELEKFLSDELRLPKSSIRVIRGETSRLKHVLLSNVKASDLGDCLGLFIGQILPPVNQDESVDYE